MSDLTLDIWGDGPEKEHLQKLILTERMENNVFLRGNTKQVHQKLAEADIYLLTSFQEGFPNALSEAMTVGLPSVSFHCHSGMDELVQDGVNGFLVEPEDADAFCQKVYN